MPELSHRFGLSCSHWLSGARTGTFGGNLGIRQLSALGWAHPRNRGRRRIRHLRELTGPLLLVAGAGAACSGDEREAPGSTAAAAADEVVRTGDFASGGGVLYRMSGDELQPLVALPGAGPAADTVRECASAIPELAAARFVRLNLSPDSSRLAWETAGPGACVGAVGPEGERSRLLSRWTAAVPDTILWAPAGPYLAVWLKHAAGRRSVEVYDAAGGRRLAMPWDDDCALSEACDVNRLVWVGGTLLDVEIKLGPGELAVPFEVNVAAPAAGQEEEIADE